MTLMLVIGNEKSGETYSDDVLGRAFLEKAVLKVWENLYTEFYLDFLSVEKNVQIFIKSVEFPCIGDVLKKMCPKIYQKEDGAELFGLEDSFWNKFKESIL